MPKRPERHLPSQPSEKQPPHAKQLDSIGHLSYTEPIYQQVRAWRLYLKLTQCQLAQELQVDERTIRRFERGLHKPHPGFANRLQEWLAEVSAAEHMVREGVPPPYWKSP